MRCPRLSSRQSAVALPLVLWAVFVVATVTVAALRIVDYDIDLEAQGEKRFAARQAAVSGIALGMHPKIARGDALLSQTLPDGTKMDVQILSEDARLNINVLLKEHDTANLKALFRLWGLTLEQSSMVIDSLKDWVDADNLSNLNGSEENAGNRPFLRVSEMAQVRGMDAVIAAKPDWMDFFSVKSTGKLDLQEVPADLLQAIGRLTHDQAQALISYRNGPDHKPGTMDDKPVTSIDVVGGIIALENSQRDALSKYFGEGSIRRVVSHGMIGAVTYEVAVVAVKPKEGEQPSYLEWTEK